MEFQRAMAFEPSNVKLLGWLSRQRINYRLRYTQPPPAFEVVKPCWPNPKWTLFFLFAPEGSLKESQRATIKRLKQLERKLLIVCATPYTAQIPQEVADLADALIWKELRGWDFSGYTVGLREIDHVHRAATFGILIGEKECWGKGYGTEVTRVMADFAFAGLGLHNVMLTVSPRNERGVRAYRRAGFREIGRRRQAHRVAGQPEDVIMMDCVVTQFERPNVRWNL